MKSAIKSLTIENMGLDMTAVRRVYVKQWDHQKPEYRYTVEIARGGKPVVGIRSDRISHVEEEVMTWRKANHIHGWFVNQVMSGDDPNDGQRYFVSEENLRQLHKACYEVLKASHLVSGMVKNGYHVDEVTGQRVYQQVPGKVIRNPEVAQTLLPTVEGFFFGGYDYDEYYLSDVEDTLNWTLQMLADIKDGVPGDIYYSSSW